MYWRFWILFLVAIPQVEAAGFDAGVGLSFVDQTTGDGFDSAWDVQVGHEFARTSGFNVGAQLQLTQSITSKSSDDVGEMNYSSGAIYLTARPHNWWLQFKGGVVRGKYNSVSGEESNTGYGAGLGIVMDFDGIKFHILDYQRFVFDNDSFNVYTVSLSAAADMPF